MLLQTKTSALLLDRELKKVSELQDTLDYCYGYSLWAARAFV